LWWFSNYSGYYFVTAPEGTYTLNARPANGPQDVTVFSPYSEYNFVVNGNLEKNITVGVTSPLPTPSPNTLSVELQHNLDGQAYFNDEKVHTSPQSVKLMIPENATQGSCAMALYPYGGTLSSLSSFSITASYMNAAPRFILCLEQYGRGWADTFLLSDYQAASNGDWKATTGGNRWGWTETNINLTSYGKIWNTLDYWVSKYGDLKVTHIGIVLEYWAVEAYGYGEPLYADEITVNGVTYNIQPATGAPSPSPTPTPSPSPSPTPSPSSSPSPSPTPSPSPSSTPMPLQSPPTYSDDFSADSGAWEYLGSAYRDQTNEYLVLTESGYDKSGVAFFKAPVQGSFTANFRYKAGGGNHGDGFTMFFYKQKYSSLDAGGSQGFSVKEGSELKVVPGYGIEFDAWQNIPADFQQFTEKQQNPQGDPSANHNALIKDFSGNHLAYVDDLRVTDNNWHQVTVEVQESSIRVFVDQELVLQWTGALDRTYDGFGFSGATGGVGSNWHIIDDFSITTRHLQKPSLTTSCRSSTSYSGFNVQINGYLTLNGTGISEAPILLSYNVTGGKSWQDLTLDYTDSDGSYSTTWLPSVTGNYQLKAVYEGDADALGASSETVNFAVVPITENNLLSVSSNSIVTSLAFNSTTSELSFAVSGPSETTGYVKVAIAKSLVSNAENIKVYLDGNQLNY
jgi:hypothetical protein